MDFNFAGLTRLRKVGALKAFQTTQQTEPLPAVVSNLITKKRRPVIPTEVEGHPNCTLGVFIRFPPVTAGLIVVRCPGSLWLPMLTWVGESYSNPQFMGFNFIDDATKFSPMWPSLDVLSALTSGTLKSSPPFVIAVPETVSSMMVSLFMPKYAVNNVIGNSVIEIWAPRSLRLAPAIPRALDNEGPVNWVRIVSNIYSNTALAPLAVDANLPIANIQIAEEAMVDSPDSVQFMGAVDTGIQNGATLGIFAPRASYLGKGDPLESDVLPLDAAVATPMEIGYIHDAVLPPI